jgi:asparagine synthase (glutamine-hydrolysing)
MCGIAGIYLSDGSIKGNQREALEDMASVMRHRGPDDSGLYLSEHCGFSFRRLSIIDLERGHQPMFSATGNTVVVFNGEIYNFKELRSELESAGSEFRTNSDTEVIVAGYEVWGEEVVNRLRGMFAFALYDTRKNSLFIARDHTGIKPFYYFSLNGSFVFASEIKSILKYPGITAGIRESMLPKYMSFLWVPAPDTLFKDIYMLEPGHLMRVSENGIRKRRYWNPDLVTEDKVLTEHEWIERIDSELLRIVKEQMVSDVPFGAFLSGGVDSSSIISYMNRASDNAITTYTAGFSEEDLSRDVIRSDLEYARVAAKRLDVEYNEIILKPDVVDLLPRLVWHMDDPVADPAAITTYLICSASKEKATVMLSGVGGDEVFGGYPRYLANMIAEKYTHIPRALRKILIESWISLFPSGSRAFFRNARKFLKSADLPFRERCMGYLTYYSEPELRELLRADFNWEDIFDMHMGFIEEYISESPVQTMMNLDLKTFLPNLNLLYTDKMSSAASVEVRVPFLDHLFIEEMSRIPSGLKIRKGRRKYILKKSAEKRLPHDVVWRKKAGFGAPVGAWLKGEAREMMMDLLSEETIKKRGYFNHKYVSRVINNHLLDREYNANHLWQLMTLELWHREFIDK